MTSQRAIGGSFLFSPHDTVAETLTAMLAAERLPHTLLFYGARGLGKKTLCRHMAAALLGEDASCVRRILEDKHPDVRFVEHSGARQGFSVETLRELAADAALRPNEAGGKVYILADCGQISIPAQNTLLKLLEEPPPGVYFFLTAESRAVFLPTILSRAVSVGLSPVTEEQCRNALLARGVAPEQAEETVAAFGGNLGRCLEAVNEPEALAPVRAARAIAQALSAGNEYTMLRTLFPLESDRAFAEAALWSAAEILGDVCTSKLVPKGTLSGPDREGAKTLATRLSLGQAKRAAEALMRAGRSVRENANMTLLLAGLSGELLAQV